MAWMVGLVPLVDDAAASSLSTIACVSSSASRVCASTTRSDEMTDGQRSVVWMPPIDAVYCAQTSDSVISITTICFATEKSTPESSEL